jgi:hypothetical protein
MNEQWFDISDYFILPHCRRRWKKRWLDFTPRGEKRSKDIEEAIKPPMKLIREYPDRGTLRVTDQRYEFVVDPVRKVIITLNAFKKETPKDVYLKKKRGYDDGTIP